MNDGSHTLSYLLRHAIRVMMSVLLVLMVGSCDVHEFSEPPEPTPPEPPTPDPVCQCVLHLSFDTQEMPLHTVITYEEDGTTTTRSRSAADPHDFRYQVVIYRDNSSKGGNFTSLATPVWKTITLMHPGEDRDLDCDIPLELPEGSYRIYVWGDFVTQGTQVDKYYDTSDITSLKVLDDELGMHPGNKLEREAFRGEASVNISETMVAPYSDETIHIYSELERPLARFKFVTTDVEKFLDRLQYEAANKRAPMDGPAYIPSLDDYTTVVRYTSYMPSAYNAVLDVPVDSRTGRYFTGVINPLDGQSAEMGHDYVLVNHRDAAVQVALETYERRTGQKVASTPPITVPLKRGHITEVRGAFLSSDVKGGMGINPDYDGDYIIVIN